MAYPTNLDQSLVYYVVLHEPPVLEVSFVLFQGVYLPGIFDFGNFLLALVGILGGGIDPGVMTSFSEQMYSHDDYVAATVIFPHQSVYGTVGELEAALIAKCSQYMSEVQKKRAVEHLPGIVANYRYLPDGTEIPTSLDFDATIELEGDYTLVKMSGVVLEQTEGPNLWYESYATYYKESERDSSPMYSGSEAETEMGWGSPADFYKTPFLDGRAYYKRFYDSEYTVLYKQGGVDPEDPEATVAAWLDQRVAFFIDEEEDIGAIVQMEDWREPPYTYINYADWIEHGGEEISIVAASYTLPGYQHHQMGQFLWHTVEMPIVQFHWSGIGAGGSYVPPEVPAIPPIIPAVVQYGLALVLALNILRVVFEGIGFDSEEIGFDSEAVGYQVFQ